MSASMMVRLTETTRRSPCRCFSTTKLQRTSMCFERFLNRFSRDKATADSQSSYMIVGWGWRKPSSVQSLRRKTASWEALESAMISLSATFSAMRGVLVLRQETGPLLHMKIQPMELARLEPSLALTSAKLASLQP